MNVRDLIELLNTLDPKLPICYELYSEYKMLEKDELSIEKHCKPRPDGWVANARPDKELIEYLVLPGN